MKNNNKTQRKGEKTVQKKRRSALPQIGSIQDTITKNESQDSIGGVETIKKRKVK